MSSSGDSRIDGSGSLSRRNAESSSGFRFLKLDRIAFGDPSFDLGFARNDEDLRRSIGAVGIVQPLVVRRNTGGIPASPHQIVCGFGRVRVARELGLDVAPARILETETTDADCLRLALFDNLGHRAFNPIERAIVLSRFEPHVGRDRLIADYMPLLGMQPSGTLLDRTVRLAGLDDSLKRAVAAGRIEEKIGILLSRFDPDDQGAFAHLLHRCRPSVSLAREFAGTLADLARRDTMSVSDLLSAPEAAAILEAGDTKPAERAAALREHLRLLRYPNLSKCEEAFSEVRAALHLPPSMRLDHAPQFESDDLRLEIRFKSHEELKQASATVASWFDDPLLLDRLWPLREPE